MFSKSLAKKFPNSLVTRVQGIICLVLLVVIAIMSFGPIFTMDLDPDIADQVETALEKLDSEADLEVPETVEVSFPFMIKSIGSLGDLFKTMAGTVKTATGALKGGVETMDEADAEKLQNDMNKAQDDIKNLGKNQDFVNLLAFGIALAASFKSSWILGLCHVFLVTMVFVVPLVAVIRGIMALVSFLKNKDDAARSFRGVARSFVAIVGLLPLILLLKTLIPELQLGSGIMGILYMSIIGLVVCLAASRLKYYDKPEFKYLNVMQIVSACSFGAFMVFFTNMTKSNVMGEMFKQLGKYLLKVNVKKIDFEVILPVLLVLAFVIILISVFTYLTQIVTRLTCMSKSKTDSHVVTAVINALVVVIPFVLAKTKLELELSDAVKETFVPACVGLVLMLVVEIAMAVLSKTLCADVSVERRQEIVTGTYSYDLVEEAPAEEAVAEEAPAEETVAEEAPAEETVVEEASAEEAVAEEAPVEEAPAEEEAK